MGVDMKIRIASFGFSIALASFLAAAPSSSSKAGTGEEIDVAVISTLALSSIWVGAVIDTENQVPVRGAMTAVWPDSEDDVDVDAVVALQRRAHLGAPAVRAIAAAHPRVGSVCVGAGEGRATVFVVGDKSIAAIETTLALAPVKNGRVLPLAPPTVTVIPIVGDLRATFEPIAKQRSCIPVEHSRGAVDFKKERLSINLPARAPHPPLGAACADEASIVVAAQRFADLLGERSRDTVRALPQPFAHPSVVTASQAHVAINAMSALSSWTDKAARADTAVRRADSAMAIVKQGPDGKPIGAQIVLRAPKTSIRMYLQIVDGMCSMSSLPTPWFEHGEASAATSPLIVRWQRNGTTWTKASP